MLAWRPESRQRSNSGHAGRRVTEPDPFPTMREFDERASLNLLAPRDLAHRPGKSVDLLSHEPSEVDLLKSREKSRIKCPETVVPAPVERTLTTLGLSCASNM